MTASWRRATEAGSSGTGDRRGQAEGNGDEGLAAPRASRRRQRRGFDEPIASRHLESEGPFDLIVSSVDSWDARRQLADLSRAHGVPLMLSAGSSFFGGFERIVRKGAACMYKHGVEQLDRRPGGTRRSCADAPEPSSLIPQAILGGLAARDLRELWLGRDIDPRGTEVHLCHRGDEGLSYSPGRLLNQTCSCEVP